MLVGRKKSKRVGSDVQDNQDDTRDSGRTNLSGSSE